MKQSALSLRALLEYRMASSGVFLTLTYASAPEKLEYSDCQKFLKRLRTWNHRKGNPMPIRFLSCGEYGGRTGRPHFHSLIFNSTTPSPQDWLTRLWPHGYVHVGTVTPASIRYTARYLLKFGKTDQVREKDDPESLAFWSKSPPLGAPGMIELAQYMRRNGYKLEQGKPPSTMKIEGHSYWLDQTMKKAFSEGYYGEATSPGNAASAHLAYLVQKKLGDPVAEQQRLIEHRAAFWSTARFLQEKL